MSIKTIKSVCVIGAGLMGKQIALNAAIKGYKTSLTDSFPDALQKADSWTKGYLEERVAKNKLTKEEADSASKNFKIVSGLKEAASGADLVIEAIIEKREEKEKLFKSLNDLVSEDTIIVTNSSFMVSSLFKNCIKNPGRLANLHYFNPALSMRLVEIVKGEHTADDTAKSLHEFVNGIGKVPVLIKKEIDGFIVNRIARAITFAALEIVSLGVADPIDVDLALENGLNHPMGPFKLMDFTGVDLTYYVMSDLEKAGEHHLGYELVKEKFEKGEFGTKSGKGWYDYSANKEK